MANNILMKKALEVDSKSASSSESSSKVSNSGSNNGSCKTDGVKIESDCKNCMKECKICNIYAYLTIKSVGLCMPKKHIKLMWLVRYDPIRVIPNNKLHKHLQYLFMI
ncbi:hypothetical protein Hanom_Chr00s021830g01761111 [Helianthus anomalus]